MRLSTATSAQHETRPDPSGDNDQQAGILQPDEHPCMPNQRPWPHEQIRDVAKLPIWNKPRDAPNVARRRAADDDEQTKAVSEI
jgi:hypothetical protein